MQKTARVGYPRSVMFYSGGFNDVLWCPWMNLSFINEYKVDENGVVLNEPTCPYCGDSYEEETHEFICHVSKPYSGCSCGTEAK